MIIPVIKKVSLILSEDPIVLCEKGSGPLIIPNDNILDWSKFKAFADDKINVG